MKRHLILPVIALSILALALSCKMPTGHKDEPTVPTSPTTPTKAKGRPVKASISGAKGLFLTSAAASISATKVSRNRNIVGRSVVASSGASLGAVTSAGPTTATWTDANNNTVTVTVSQALQLEPDYVLISYSGDFSGTGVIKISTGAFATVDTPPDTWILVYATKGYMYYEAGGSIYKTSEDTGAGVVLSSQAEVWGNGVDKMMTSPWDNMAWVFVDILGDAYAVDEINSDHVLAQLITAAGSTIDIGACPYCGDLANAATAILTGSTNHMVLNSDGTLWWMQLESGGSDYVELIFPITFNPAAGASNIMTWYNVAPTSSIHFCDQSLVPNMGQGRYGMGISAASTVFSNGARSVVVAFSGSAPVFQVYDTSSVPATIPLSQGSLSWTGRPSNWTYSGAQIYTGPTDTSSTVTMVKLGAGGSVANPTLLSDPGLISWQVVGGALFWTDSSGSQTAAIDVASGTLGAASAYSGSVTAVTQ